MINSIAESLIFIQTIQATNECFFPDLFKREYNLCITPTENRK